MRKVFIPIIGNIQSSAPIGQVTSGEMGLYPAPEGWYVLDKDGNYARILTELDLVGGLIQEGTRSSAIHPGTKGQVSMDDDYFYLCTQTGESGNAIWKRMPIFKSP